MYIAVLVILLGWAVAFDSRALWIYAACVAIALHLRVVLGEEPWLPRTHGERWTLYRAAVPRWLLLFRRARRAGHNARLANER